MRNSLGDRMEEYQTAGQTRLLRRTPVIVRVDGRAFHTLTRKMEKPCDRRFQACMWEAGLALCEDAQGARIAYAQSDEISVLIYESDVRSSSWFDYDRDKIVSSAAATATAAFLLRFRELFPEVKLSRKSAPRFDGRATNYPPHEVVNYFIWRQQDATRNSISGLGRAHFSHKQLHGKSGAQIQDMLHNKGVNWNDCPTPQKRGACIVKRLCQTRDGDCPRAGAAHSEWVVDENTPIFTQDRHYIDQHLLMES